MPLTNLIKDQIEVDKSITIELSKRLLAKIPRDGRGLLQENSTSHHSLILMDVNEEEWQVWIRLHTVWVGAPGGKQSTQAGDLHIKYIDITINDVFLAREAGLLKVSTGTNGHEITLGANGRTLNPTEQDQMNESRFNLIYTLLLHEITHARDTDTQMEGLKTIDSWDNADEAARRDYVNQGPETRALLNQLVDDLEKHTQEGDTVETALNRSVWWREYLGKYLEPDTKATLVEKISAWLNESRDDQ